VGPKDQTRVVLDELIRLLSAERAYVWLAEPGGLYYFTGRDLNSTTLHEPTNFSQTVVDMVRTQRQPLVIAGTEQGEVLGSKSVIDNNLRSIICAPLTVREEFAGIIYLDNRLAKGVFNEEDVGILQAVSNHISVGIETARAARLEVEVESERRQRALADVLSEFTMSLSSTLEPDTIVQQLLDTLSRAVPFVRASVWMGAPESLQLVASRHYPEALRTGTVRIAAEHFGFDRATESKRPVVENCQGADPVSPQVVVSQPFSWLALPLLSDRRVAGIVTLSAERSDAYSEAEVEVAFTFCNQAGIALANAHLFKEINRLATTDALTNVYNRRRFYQIAERELERCRRDAMPFSVIMTDVDFFKKFNDQYGHACGDEVLRRVAQLGRETVGEIGALGRYGGEEFVVALSGFELSSAKSVAEKLRVAVEAYRLDYEGQVLQVTLSLGVAQVASGETLEQVLARADSQLYEAKRAGRNRVV
jgi:diguanylate cyclase (GGDEF)-like protein